MILDVYIAFFPLGFSLVWSDLQNCQSKSFRREGFVQTDIGSQYEPYADRVGNISLLACIQHAERGDFRWLLYNKISWTCAVSVCRSLPVTVTKTPTDYFLYVSQVHTPSSCSDIKLNEGRTDDGEYWLTPAAAQMLGCPTKVYCLDMASPSPREFITLPTPNEGEFPNKSNLGCKDELPYLVRGGVGKEGHYFFNKIAVKVETMTVKKDDYAFVTITEGKTYPYGHAEDCYAGNHRPCGLKGIFHINTLGTGLLVDPKLQWQVYGWRPYNASVRRSAGGAKIDLLCGGECGGCTPAGVVTLYPNTEDIIN